MRVIAIPGYQHFAAGGVTVFAVNRLAAMVRDVLREEPLYAYAARVATGVGVEVDAGTGGAVLEGRAPVYALPFGLAGERVVVRHAMRGGLLGRVLRDRFLPPTRVARELAASFRLRLMGVPTPEVLAVATYPAGPLFRRADIMTAFTPGADLAAVFGDPRNDAQRRPLLDAVARLLTRLTEAGAQHPDLNLKNVLVTSTESGYVAHVLDVDRVHFHVPGDPLVARANLDRLLRSLRRWRALPATRAGALPDDDIAHLALAAATVRA